MLPPHGVWVTEARIASAASITSRAADSVTSDVPARSRCAGTTLASGACGPHEPATSKYSKCYSCCTLSLSLGSVILTRGVVYPPFHLPITTMGGVNV